MPETYSVDDLRAPRLSPTQRQMLEFTEGLTVDFDIDTVIDEAVQTSGVTNFDGEGFDEDFRKRLNMHFDAIEADDMMLGKTKLPIHPRRAERPIVEREFPLRAFQVHQQHLAVSFFGETPRQRSRDELIRDTP